MRRRRKSERGLRGGEGRRQRRKGRGLTAEGDGTIAEERRGQDLLEEGTGVVRRGPGHQEMREGSLGRSAERKGGARLDGTIGHRQLGIQDRHLAFQLLQTPMRSLWRPGEVVEAVVLL